MLRAQDSSPNDPLAQRDRRLVTGIAVSALLHLGGTRILGVLKVTMDGKDGVRMMQVVRPKKTVPIHYNDYDVFKSPLEDFAREVKAAGLEKDVIYLAHGETHTFSRVQR